MKRPVLLVIMLSFALLVTVTVVEEGGSAQVPPTITGVRVLNVDEDSFEVEWETDTPTKGFGEWGKTKDYTYSKELGGSFETYHKTNVTGLKRTTKYHFRIVAENLAGDVGYSSDNTVMTGPQDEVEGGTPGWMWGLVAMVAIVLFVYMFLLRPAQR